MQSSPKKSKASGTSRNLTIKTTVQKTGSAKAKKPVVKAVKSKLAVKEEQIAKHKYVTFQVQSRPGSKVYLAGDFNNWNHLDQELCDYDGNGIYQAVVALEPGSYEYKFHINDVWCADPGNPNFRPNHMGTLNSIIIVE